ncbi:hypothetical protein LWI28_016642 [Acer negundo]|uniref:PABC domain-containing protein n=1 Tax=Acer negundo TaxID=4023 RepID=A0AAD5P5W6_ACENE|nr:hypothetical protein LWI28_016642 [Acer negundo]
MGTHLTIEGCPTTLMLEERRPAASLMSMEVTFAKEAGELFFTIEGGDRWVKQSLTLVLVHFYPLTGRLKTLKSENPHSFVIFVDIKDSPGARIIHASLDMTVSDIVSATYVPVVIQSLFDNDQAINHDGHTKPLLSIQVTDLVDGIFIGCSMNHCLGDEACYWNFLSALSEIFLGQGKSSISISHPPIIKRWFPDGHDPFINLPFTHHDEFLSRYEPPKLLEKYFHFTAESIARLKAKVNSECNTDKISSFQSLSALVWRSMTRARCLPNDETTICFLAIDNRSRLEPPLSQDYFGVCVGMAKAGELLEHDLGCAAWKLHQAVVGHTNKTVIELLDSWRKSPIIYNMDQMFNARHVWIGSSPRFNKYGIEFGLGKAVTLRSGSRPEPPLSQDYFGVSIGGVSGRATADELLEHDLGWAAWKLHQAVVGYTDKTVLESLDSWRKSPIIYKAGEMNNPRLVWMGSSPRFNKPINLTPWDLAMLSVQYIQKGHLYTKPAVDDQEEFINTLLDKLKQPLSLTLVHFYPLVDRFKTVKSEDTKSCLVFVDLNDSPGAKLIHASSDMTVSDIVSLTYVPLFVQSLFDHERAINHDGHTTWKLHEAVVNHNDKTVRGFLESWRQSPMIYQLGQLFDLESVVMGSSPRFNKYGIEFGLGKAVTLRSGYAHKFDGTVSSYTGHEGGGSVDFELCLPPQSMHSLESDEEFIQLLGESLYPQVEQLERDAAAKVTGMLLEMDRIEVLRLLESPEALKAKVAEVVEVLRTVAAQPQRPTCLTVPE